MLASRRCHLCRHWAYTTVLLQLVLPTMSSWRLPVLRPQLSPDNLVSTLQQALIDESEAAWMVDWSDLTDDALSSKSSTQSVGSGPAAKRLKEMMGCMNGVYTGQSMSWEAATHDQLGDLKAVAGVFTKQDPNVQVTVTTFGALNRLQQLYTQCMRWQGPLSVVLYEPLLQSPNKKGLTAQSRTALKSAIIRLVQFVSELQRHPGACQLDLLLTYEVVTEEAALHLIPVNLLRNYARLMARTPMIAGLDIDLLPSRSLYLRLSDSSKDLEKQVAKGQDFVFIIPTFDLNQNHYHAAWADALTLLDKKDLMVKAMELKIVEPFLVSWLTGHGLTNFERWKTATQDYTTKYEYRCEPWLLSSRTNLPWHDARFRGRGENKLQHVLSVYHAGHHFKVLHDAFTIHRVHKVAANRAFYFKEKIEGQGSIHWRTYVDGLFLKQAERHNASLPYEPMNPPGVTNCMNKLSWW